MKPEIESQIIAAAANTFSADPRSVTRETTLSSLNAGSIQLVSLCALIEDITDTDVPLRDVVKCATIGEMLDVIDAKLD